MFDEYNAGSPFLNMGLDDDVEIEWDEGFADEIDESELDPDELELEQEEAQKEQELSQAQGDWLDGYLDAMDEWEEDEE